MFITKKRHNEELNKLKKQAEEIKMLLKIEKKETKALNEYLDLCISKKIHNEEIDELKKQLTESQEALTLSQNRVKSEKHYYINNMLEQILKDLKEEKYKDDNPDLNFQYIKNEETDKYEVTTSFCQLCGVESEVHIFNTEIEAWLFCKVKTMNGDILGSTCHSDCYTEYMREFVL